MPAQFSITGYNAALNAIEAEIGASPIMEIRSGAKPANCAAANTAGSLLAELFLPADAFADAATAQKVMAGTWEDTSANAAGTAGYYRVWNNAKTVCHIQGSITATGGGGDMQLDNTSIALGQKITITNFVLNGEDI